MKMKGISFIEQNVEKIVVVVVGLIAVGAVGMQFVGRGNMVEVDKQLVPPDKVFEPVARKANEVRTRIERADPDLPKVPEVALMAKFEERLTGRYMPVERLPSLARGPRIQFDVQEAVADALYAELTPPAPSQPVAHAFWCTIDPLQVVTFPELAPYLPEEQPFDKAAVSVQVLYDGTALRAALERAPEGLAPVRLTWWRDRISVIGFEVERQERTYDGRWPTDPSGAPVTELIGQLPGYPDIAEFFVESARTAGDVGALLDAVRPEEHNILRPPFYRTMMGTPEWVEPMLVTAAEGPAEPAGDRDVSRLVLEIRQLGDRITTMQRTLQQPTQAPREQTPPPGGGRGRGVAPPPTQTRQGEMTAEQRRRQQMEQQIQRLETERSSKEEELRRRGFTPDGKRIATTPAAAPGGRPTAEPSLLDNPSVKLWAHDVTAEPGRMYRYRTRVKINNPFFGQAGALKPEQKHLAESPVLAGEWSSWSSPVTVEYAEYFFITSGSEQGPIGGPRATAELYRFYYGYPRKATITIQPGDLIAGEARLPKDLVVFDIQKLLDAREHGLPGAPPMGEPAGPGAGKTGPGGTPGRDDMREAPIGGEGPSLTDLGTPAPERLQIMVDALLLDVASGVTEVDRGIIGAQMTRSTIQVFIKDRDGNIIVRNPEEERNSAVYRRLAAAARLGETQGEARPEPARPEPRVVPPPPPPPTRPGPGGGGGGGGGGG